MKTLSRRTLFNFSMLGAKMALFADATDSSATAPALRSMIRHPLLVRSIYRVSVSRSFNPDGAAGKNREGFEFIEEQRQGAEWIVRGYAQNRFEWIELGWRQLEWGLAQQQTDGGFGSKDPFHSTSLFVEALARACIVDPEGATDKRKNALAKAAAWMTTPSIEQRGTQNNLPNAHRRYICAAGLGQAGSVTGLRDFSRRAAAWAEDGMAMQRVDGTNPEKGGYDAGYQMVGVLMTLRYLPVVEDGTLRAHLRGMIRKAVPLELARQSADGTIDAEGSTRVGLEHVRGGQIKTVPYHEILQALVYGAVMVSKPEWITPAELHRPGSGVVKRLVESQSVALRPHACSRRRITI